jgi:predicted nucleic acid-binding Zn ribbon protein
MGKKPKHIGNALNLMFKDLGFDKKMDQVRAVELWAEIVGESIAQISSAERVSDGILYVKVKSMTWRTELLFQKRNILERIEKRIGGKVVHDIRFF